MKMKQFRSILALAVVAAPIIVSLSPAQAIPLDEILDSAGKSFVRGMFGMSGDRQESSQSGGFNNDTPQPQATPSSSAQSSGFSNDSPQPQTPPQQNNNSASSPPPQQPRTPFRSLQTSCVKASNEDVRGIGRDDSDSMVSVGQRSVSVSTKTGIYANTPLQMTCAITRHPTDGKARIAFAIPDNSTLENVRLSIYVDGREIFSNIISRGQVRGKVVDITGASSYAYILQPLNGGYGDIYWPRIPQRRPVAN